MTANDKKEATGAPKGPTGPSEAKEDKTKKSSTIEGKGYDKLRNDKVKLEKELKKTKRERKKYEIKGNDLIVKFNDNRDAIRMFIDKYPKPGYGGIKTSKQSYSDSNLYVAGNYDISWKEGNSGVLSGEDKNFLLMFNKRSMLTRLAGDTRWWISEQMDKKLDSVEIRGPDTYFALAKINGYDWVRIYKNGLGIPRWILLTVLATLGLVGGLALAPIATKMNPEKIKLEKKKIMDKLSLLPRSLVYSNVKEIKEQLLKSHLIKVKEEYEVEGEAENDYIIGIAEKWSEVSDIFKKKDIAKYLNFAEKEFEGYYEKYNLNDLREIFIDKLKPYLSNIKELNELFKETILESTVVDSVKHQEKLATSPDLMAMKQVNTLVDKVIELDQQVSQAANLSDPLLKVGTIEDVINNFTNALAIADQLKENDTMKTEIAALINRSKGAANVANSPFKVNCFEIIKSAEKAYDNSFLVIESIKSIVLELQGKYTEFKASKPANFDRVTERNQIVEYYKTVETAVKEAREALEPVVEAMVIRQTYHTKHDEIHENLRAIHGSVTTDNIRSLTDKTSIYERVQGETTRKLEQQALIRDELDKVQTAADSVKDKINTEITQLKIDAKGIFDSWIDTINGVMKNSQENIFLAYEQRVKDEGAITHDEYIAKIQDAIAPFLENIRTLGDHLIDNGKYFRDKYSALVTALHDISPQDDNTETKVRTLKLLDILDLDQDNLEKARTESTYNTFIDAQKKIINDNTKSFRDAMRDLSRITKTSDNYNEIRNFIFGKNKVFITDVQTFIDGDVKEILVENQVGDGLTADAIKTYLDPLTKYIETYYSSIKDALENKLNTDADLYNKPLIEAAATLQREIAGVVNPTLRALEILKTKLSTGFTEGGAYAECVSLISDIEKANDIIAKINGNTFAVINIDPLTEALEKAKKQSQIEVSGPVGQYKAIMSDIGDDAPDLTQISGQEEQETNQVYDNLLTVINDKVGAVHTSLEKFQDLGGHYRGVKVLAREINSDIAGKIQSIKDDKGPLCKGTIEITNDKYNFEEKFNLLENDLKEMLKNVLNVQDGKDIEEIMATHKDNLEAVRVKVKTISEAVKLSQSGIMSISEGIISKGKQIRVDIWESGNMKIELKNKKINIRLKQVDDYIKNKTFQQDTDSAANLVDAKATLSHTETDFEIKLQGKIAKIKPQTGITEIKSLQEFCDKSSGFYKHLENYLKNFELKSNNGVSNFNSLRGADYKNKEEIFIDKGKEVQNLVLNHVFFKTGAYLYLSKYEETDTKYKEIEGKINKLSENIYLYGRSQTWLFRRLADRMQEYESGKRVVIVVLEQNGLGDKISGIEQVWGVTVRKFLELEKDKSIADKIGKELNLTEAEIMKLNLAASRIKTDYDKYKADKEKQLKESIKTKEDLEKKLKEEDEAKKKLKDKEKDKYKDKYKDKDKEKTEEEKKEEKTKKEEIKVETELKEEIEKTPQNIESKDKKLEYLKKLDELRKQKEDEIKLKETDYKLKIETLQTTKQNNESRIDRLKNEQQITVETINQSIKELQSYKAGYNEITEKKRNILIDAVEKLKKKHALQDKEYSDIVLENEKHKQLLVQMKGEGLSLKQTMNDFRKQAEKLEATRHETIQQGIQEEKEHRQSDKIVGIKEKRLRKQVEELKMVQREKENKFKREIRELKEKEKELEKENMILVESKTKKKSISKRDKSLLVEQDKFLQRRGELDQKLGRSKKSLKKTKDIPITYVPPKKLTKKKQPLTRKKPRRKKPESFIESITPDFMKV